MVVAGREIATELVVSSEVALRGISSGKPFQARYAGRCRACKKPFEPGDWIYGQGKGYGVIHKRCMKTAGLVVRQMTAEERSRVGRSD
jgi:hypothetical protein